MSSGINGETEVGVVKFGSGFRPAQFAEVRSLKIEGSWKDIPAGIFREMGDFQGTVSR